MNSTKITKQLANFLRQQLGLKELSKINSKAQLIVLQQSLKDWFADPQCPIANTDYLERFEVLHSLLLEGTEGYVKFSDQLNELALLQFTVEFLPHLLVQTPFKKTDRWVFPVQSALHQLKSKKYIELRELINVFEALIHLHFVTLASQFYWSLQDADFNNKNDNISAGVSVLFETLQDASCGGGVTWLERATRLSVASQSVQERLPFSELVDILQPSDFRAKLISPNVWGLKGKSSAYLFLKFITKVRNQLMGHYESLNEEAHQQLSPCLTVMLNMLTSSFKPYYNLQLAMVAAKEQRLGIHCYWQGKDFLCMTNQVNRQEMQEVWQNYEAELNLLVAPEIPRESINWSDSLILYHPDKPYQNYTYLMPLGFLYQHQQARQAHRMLPGLLDSVRWRAKQVASVVQRTYEGVLPLSFDFSSIPNNEASQVSNVHKCIENIVQELCDNFQFVPLRESGSRAFAPQRVFDLGHERLATLFSQHTVERTAELARITDLLWTAKEQRLLLLGVSGSGKSVLLAQLFLQHSDNAVFVSLDDGKISVSAEDFKISPELTAQRIGMHCLAVLRRLAGLSAPIELLQLIEIQNEIRDCVTAIVPRQLMIILDGANQAVDPGGILSAMPVPLPENLFVIVSSQTQRRVIDPLTRYGQQAWVQVDIALLARSEAEQLIWRAWEESLPDRRTPSRQALPLPLLDRLCELAHGMPIYLEDWAMRLRERWESDPVMFEKNALTYFEQHHADDLPKFLRQRFQKLRDQFHPVGLLEGLLWCLSLIPKALTAAQLSDGLDKLRQLKYIVDLPTISNAEIIDGVWQLSGFLGYTRSFSDQWQLRHEVFGQWFCSAYGKSDQLPLIRLALVPLGALPLPATASPAEFAQWLQWIVDENYEHYGSLSPEIRVSIVESVLGRLERNHSDYAVMLARLSSDLLSMEEHRRAFELQPILIALLEQPDLDLQTQAELFVTLGDIAQSNNNLEQAQTWFEKSLEISEQLLAESNTPQNRRDLSISYSRLGDIAQSNNNLEQAQTWFEKYLEISEQLLAESNTPQNRRELSISYERLGDIAQSNNNLEQAQTWFEKSLEISEQLLAESNTPQNRRELSISYERLGDIAQSNNNLEQAQTWFEKSLEISEQLLAESNTPQNRRELSISYERLGDIAQSNNNLEQAQTWFEKSLEIREQLLAESNTPQNRRDLSIAYSWLGDIAQSNNNLEQAQTWFEKSLEIREQLLAESNTPQNRRELSIAYSWLGDIAQSNNNLEQAQTWFEKSLEIREQLLAESNTPQNRRDLSISYNKLGSLAKSNNNLEQAQTWFEKSLEIREQLLAESNTPQNRRELSISYERLGDIAKSNNNLEQAQTWFEKSLEIREQLLAESNTPQNRRELSISYSRLGDIAQSNNNLEQAQTWFEKSLEISEQLLAESNTPQNRRDLSISYSRLGDIAQSNNNLEQAQTWFEKYLEISEQLLAESNTPQNRRELSISYERLGDIAQSNNNLEQAQTWFEKSLEISEQLLAESNTPQNRRELSISYERLGDIAQSNNNLEQAQTWFEKSLEIREQLLAESNTPQNRRELSISYSRLGDIAQSNNNLEQAQTWFEKSLEISEQLLAESNTPQNRRDLSISYSRLGDIAQSNNNLEQAQTWFEKSLEIREQLLAESNTPQNRRELSISYSRLGDIAQSNNNLEQAQTWFEKYLEISEQLLAESNTPQNRRDLSISYSRLGDIAKSNNNLEQAQTWFEKYLEISEQLLAESNTPQNRRELSIAYSWLGDIAKSNNNLEQAQTWFEKSLEIREQLLAESK